MYEQKPLTINHKSEIISLFKLKFKQAKTTLPNLFDDLLVDEFLNQKLDHLLINNTGFGIFHNNKLVSYLIGYSNIDSLKGKEKGVYIPIWGHFSNQEDKNHFYQLYLNLAQEWADNKIYNQILTYFPSFKLFQEQLYTLGFGLLVIDAIRPMDLIPNKDLQTSFLIRNLSPNEFADINKLDGDFSSYMHKSPTFLHVSPDLESSTYSDFMNERNQTFVVEYEGKIVAAMRGVLNSSNFDFLDTNKTIAINFAFTYHEFRGRGLGTHLLNAILDWGQKNKATRCTVDFESANLIANRFWLNHFSPIGYSAIRKIDNRI